MNPTAPIVALLASALLLPALVITTPAAFGALPPGTVLNFDEGVIEGDGSAPPTSGSYFSMRLLPTFTVFTGLRPGPAGGIVLGQNHPASGSHTGVPDGTETPGIDQPWELFDDTGMHFINNGGLVDQGGGILLFSNRWFMTWNGIAAIDMGGCKTGINCEGTVVDSGEGTLTCVDESELAIPCGHEARFIVDYSAHVPLGDPSGLGGLPYMLHLEGTLAISATAILVDRGVLGAGPIAAIVGTRDGRITAAEMKDSTTPEDTRAKNQCEGDCFDTRVDGLASGETVLIVLPLSKQIPKDPTYRTLIDGEWNNFDESGGDEIKSAVAVDDRCPGPGSPQYTPGLTVGNKCVQLAITDGGPNDSNNAIGTVGNTGGIAILKLLFGGGTNGSGGSCTVNPSAQPAQGGAMYMLAIFLVGLYLRRRQWPGKDRN